MMGKIEIDGLDEAGDYDYRRELYSEMREKLRSLLAEENDWLAGMANMAALLYEQLPDINWAGFYLRREDGDLVLGPFQGRTACVRIPPGEGVCGTALERGRIQLVADVHEFPGHIACDPRSRSELVLPLKYKDNVIGVLDLDSPNLARFSGHDARQLERLVEIFLEEVEIENMKFFGQQ